MRFRFTEKRVPHLVTSGLYCPGIDWGYKGLHIVQDFGDYIIFKILGHKAWCGQGQQKYYETVYFVAQVLSWDAEYVTVDEQEKEYPGHQWRQCIARFIKLIEKRQCFKDPSTNGDKS